MIIIILVHSYKFNMNSIGYSSYSDESSSVSVVSISWDSRGCSCLFWVLFPYQ